MHTRLSTRLRRTAVLLATIAAVVLSMPLMARAQEANLRVELGDRGFVATSTFELNQKGIREQALAAVSELREDALNDSRVTFYSSYSKDYVTVAEYLSDYDITIEEYLNPHWSNAFERIAIQRAAETHVREGHARPSGEECFTAMPADATSWNAEILASKADIKSAVDLWAAEKSLLLSGERDQAIHYLTLVNPDAYAYGFAAIDGRVAGEAGGRPYTGSLDSNPTNLEGSYEISMRLPIEALRDSLALAQNTVGLNESVELQALLSHKRRIFVVDGIWASLSPNLAEVSKEGVATGKKSGAATVRVSVATNGTLTSRDLTLNVGVKTMYRFYNQWTGEHLYTADPTERAALVEQGWTAEGAAWVAPETSSTPVYRLYNPFVPGGDHHYTTSKQEYDILKESGWKQEGIAWYSDDAHGVELFRLYNANATTGTHHYTADPDERDALKRLGWRYEGKAWYGMKL